MGLLAPWFLAGLAALSLPIYLHLLRRHKVQPKPFSSLMFFERRTQSSVKHRRLRFYALLALRLAMLALLALLFSQPFLNRPAGAAMGKKVVVIAVDRSFSMRAADHLAEAKGQALAAIDRIRGGDVGQVVAVGSKVETMTEPVNDRNVLKAAVNAIGAGDEASSYTEFSRFLRGLPPALKMGVDAHLFTDVQQSSMPTAFADLAVGDGTRLSVHAAGSSAPNWAVESVSAPNAVYGSGKVRVSASVAGFGTAAARRTVSLVVNGRMIESKTAEVPANGRAATEFAGFEPTYGFNRGEVRIDSADPLREDDMFRFVTERTETRKVLFVREARQTPSYFKAALEAAAGSQYDIETVTAEQSANLDPSKYAFVVLADTGTLPSAFEDRVSSYVNRGGGLLVEAGPSCAAKSHIPVAGLKTGESKYAARTGDRFQTAARLDSSHPAVRDSAALDGVRFYWTVRIDPGNGAVLARLSDESPLLIEKHIGEGRALVFGSTLDNVANDLPVHASFVPFIERIAAYLSGPVSGTPSLPVGSTVVLRTERERAAPVMVLDPTGSRAIDLKQSLGAVSYSFSREGYWETQSAAGRRELFAVNADRKESDLARVSDETLALWTGSGGHGGSNQNSGPGEPVKIPLWPYFLAGLLALAAVESVVADRLQPASEAKEQLARREAA
jgi:hypothetical protein